MKDGTDERATQYRVTSIEVFHVERLDIHVVLLSTGSRLSLLNVFCRRTVSFFRRPTTLWGYSLHKMDSWNAGMQTHKMSEYEEKHN